MIIEKLSNEMVSYSHMFPDFNGNSKDFFEPLSGGRGALYYQ
jgi:hypothetical protein